MTEIVTPSAGGESFSVIGGLAGHAAMTEDLSAAVAAIDDAADCLAEATHAVRRTHWLLDQAQRNASPWHLPHLASVESRTWPLTLGGGSAPVAEQSLRDMSNRLRVVVTAMEEAESEAWRGMSWGTTAGRGLSDTWGIAVAGVRLATAGLWKVTPPGIALSAWGNDPVGGWIMPSAPNTTGLVNRDTLDSAGLFMNPAQFQLAALLASYATASLERIAHEGWWLSVSRTDEAKGPLAPPKSLADLMRQARRIEDLGDGSVGVEKVMTDQGPSYIVTLPGTQDGTLWDANPTDIQADLGAMAGQWTDAQSTALAAMFAANIPPGAPVMLVGHSQGGINAMALASTPEVTRQFHVTHVVTVGACVARFDLPPGIVSLSLEHGEDIVPGADLAPNPDTVNRTTFTHWISQSADPALREMSGSVLGAHDMDGYIATAELAESGTSTSVDRFMDSAAGFLTGGGAEYQEFRPVTTR